MKKFTSKLSFVAVMGLVFVVALCSSCELTGDSGGGSSFDFGDNDVNTVVAMGDSITDGGCAPAGASYPSRVAALSGKNVVNQGSCGEKSSGGASRVNSVLASTNPGYLLILYGANDALFDVDHFAVKENLRAIIQSAKNNMTLPILATLTPMYDGHAFGRGDAQAISVLIRELAGEEDVPLVDLEAEFGEDRSLIQADGLHPSDTGAQLIALSFNDAL